MPRCLLLALLIAALPLSAQTIYVPGGSGNVGSSANGNVGIGTSSPDQLLTVNGVVHVLDGGYVVIDRPGSTPSGSSVQLSSPAAMPGLILMVGDGSGNVSRRWDVRANASRFIVADATSGSERLTIDAAGNVGIGTTLPQQRLSIVRTSGAGSTANVQIGDAGGQWFQVNSNSSAGSWNPMVQAGDHTFYYSNGSSNTGGLVIGQWSSSKRGIRIDPNGNVGIGTGAPSHKLAVDGTIRAKEVIVDTGWSDYVFKEDYRLASLAEVEAHIREKKHLPGIPTASAVASNGVSLGDMQAMLLAKIEELTLHLIEQDKEVCSLKAEVAQLRDDTRR